MSTKELDFNNIPLYQERTFVPKEADLTDLETVQSLYEQMILSDIKDISALEKWCLKRSELESALDQAGSSLYIRMTCQTDDQSRAQSYQEFIKNISPVVKDLNDQLNKKYLKLVEEFGSISDRYFVYDRAIKADVDLFVKENVELQTQEELLSQEYQTICGAMMVDFDGEKRTMPQMSKFQYETDRDLRERAWRATAKRRLEKSQKLDDIFDKMVVLRNKIAANAQCENYCDYKFRSLNRFDYTPAQCKQYHQTMEELLVPLYKKIIQKRKDEMSVETLRPWDLAVDSLGRAPLSPFKQSDELIEGCEKIFNKVNTDLGVQFKEMKDLGMLDLSSRKGKAPGGYQSTLSESRRPFIFMNAVGLDGDVNTLLHEGGHAFHAVASRDEDLLDYRHAPMEFCEVASMSMELLGREYLDVFYPKDEKERSAISHLEDIVFVLIWVAVVDCFQHWIYENPNHTADERKNQWLKIQERFSIGLVDWSGLEEEHAFIWHRQLHIFEVPFYYIEYGIAQIGALQLWRNSKSNWNKAVDSYRAGLALGGSLPLSELFEASDIQFDFSKKTIAPLIELLKNELNIN